MLIDYIFADGHLLELIGAWSILVVFLVIVLVFTHFVREDILCGLFGHWFGVPLQYFLTFEHIVLMFVNGAIVQERVFLILVASIVLRIQLSVRVFALL